MREYQYCRIDGDTTYEEREDSIDAYNAPESEKLLHALDARGWPWDQPPDRGHGHPLRLGLEPPGRPPGAGPRTPHRAEEGGERLPVSVRCEVWWAAWRGAEWA